MIRSPTVELTATPFEDTCLFQFPSLCAIPNLAHVITSRPWNMAVHRGPERERTVERRKRICEYLRLPFEQLTAPNQIHSPHVLRVLSQDVGAGRENHHTALPFVDGLICDLPDVALMQFSADCPMIVLVEPERCILGTAHASWRGTVTEIAMELVNQLRRVFEIEPSKLIGAICPCAGPLEYEVGEEVRRIASTRLPDAERFFPHDGNTWRFDLRSANVEQLTRAGVDPANISVASISTMSDERFYSHRRDGPNTGRFALITGFQTKGC